MVDVSYSPSSSVSEDQLDGFLPEDNVERLRNIRDMFENSTNDDELVLQKVERVQPSEKLKERLTSESDSISNNLHESYNKSDNNNHIQTDFDAFDDLDSLNKHHHRAKQPNGTNLLLGTCDDQKSNTLSYSDGESTGEHNIDEELEHGFYLENQPNSSPQPPLFELSPAKSTKSSAQSILDKMDKSNNMVMQEQQQQRSINGDDSSLLVDVNGVGGATTVESSGSSVCSSSSISSPAGGSSNEPVVKAIDDPHLHDEFNDEPSLHETHEHLHAVEDDDEARSFNGDDHNRHSSENNQNISNRFEEGGSIDYEDGENEEENDEAGNEHANRSRRHSSKKDIIAFAEMSSVKTKFERIGCESTEAADTEPRPMRCITPPREGANRVEIENEPMQRAADVASVYDQVEDALPESGLIRSRKEQFASIGSPDSSAESKSVPRVKSITPPREDCVKRVLKEKTPERNENVVRESDRNDDILPSAGSAKEKAAIFASGGASSRLKSIERSGITLEGELAEKGIAKSRLALFSDPNAVAQQSQTVSTTELESEVMKNTSGIAKERLNLFKNLENQQSQSGLRTSPSKEFKKLKEFTPPPQLDHQQRQYIIIDKESSPNSSDAVKETYKEEFVPETGLAKSRMKQYLETASTSANNSSSANSQHTSPNGASSANGEGEELPGKGIAKSLLAKWKSMENVKDKETSPEPASNGRTSSTRTRATSKDRQTSPSSETPSEDQLPQSGTAKSLLNKWQNIDSNSSANKERKGPRPITPPPPEELERNKSMNEDVVDSVAKPYQDQELAIIGRGHAKSTLAKFEQSVIESSTHVRKSITPPKEYIKIASSNVMKSVYESTPMESNINAQFSEEDVIPSPGHAKQLKSKFLNLEKEATKIETSSAKMNYVPKKFTSSSSSSSTSSASTTTNGKTNGVNKPTAAKVNGTSQQQPQQQNGNANTSQNNGFLNHHASTLSGGDKCCVCDKTVYAMEKIEADKKVYHKLCFKCTSCNCTLKLGNYSSIKQTLYCTPHYIQLFSRNGNYDEGFGLENYKRKWLQRSPESATAN